MDTMYISKLNIDLLVPCGCWARTRSHPFKSRQHCHSLLEGRWVDVAPRDAAQTTIKAAARDYDPPKLVNYAKFCSCVSIR